MCIVRYIVREENEKRLSKQKKKRARDKCYTFYMTPPLTFSGYQPKRTMYYKKKPG